MRAYLSNIKQKIERNSALWVQRRKFRKLGVNLDEEQRAYLDVLKRDGIVVIPNGVTTAAVGAMQSAVNTAINEGAFRCKKGVGHDIAQSEWSEIARMNVMDTTLRCSSFIDLAVNSRYLPIIYSYLQFLPVISGIVAYRTNPVKSAPSGAFHWHFDNTPLQVKIMCYLTDVTAKTGAFAYIKGTQQPYMYETTDYADTRIEEAKVDRSREIVCEGKAGTIVLVDTTGIHRGTPNEEAKRDVVVCIYDAGLRHRRECFYNLPIPDSVALTLDQGERRLLRLPKFIG